MAGVHTPLAAQLTIIPSGTSIILTWPTNYAGFDYAGFTLQFTTNVVAPVIWRAVSPGPAVVNGQNTVTNPVSGSQRFFRLSVPAPADTNLVFIQPGTFTMGSSTNEAERNVDEVQHLVTISSGFWIEKFLVTQADYLAVVGSNPSYFTSANGYSDDLTRPVETVSWYDAINYCELRTQQERAAGLIPANYVYRLPTESEWEYAARAGTTTAFYLGSGLHSGQANFYGQGEYDASVGTIYNPSGIHLNQTTAVGSYQPNAWGLYDMAGNVGEWCQDWYGAYPAGSVTDPHGAVTGSIHVIRGGYCYYYAKYCRSAARNYYGLPGNSYHAIGFRVLLAPGQ